jgi:hypothetical protein
MPVKKAISRRNDQAAARSKDDGLSSRVDLRLFDLHDWFNLLTLPIVIFFNLQYFSTCTDWSQPGWGGLPLLANKSLQAATFGQTTNYWAFQTYVLIDTLWLILYPRSVPSAPAIIYHHLGVLVGWNMPLLNQYWAFWASLAALIEMNTFFLILKRQQGKDFILVHALFYATWVFWRCIVYPVAFVYFSIDYYNFSVYQNSHNFLHSGLALQVLIAFLNLLNAWWTWDLVRKTFWSRSDHGQSDRVKGAL